MDAAKRLKEGWIHVLVTFEVVGKPEKHVGEALRKLLDTCKEDPRVMWIEESVADPEPAQDDFFGAYAEVDMLVKDIETLTWLAANFTPASLEVIEPLSFKYSAGDIQSWYGDLLSTMHQIGAHYKAQTAELVHLRTQLGLLIENIILLSLARGPKTEAQLAKDTSLDPKAVETGLARLEKAKRIAKGAKGVYALA